MRKRWFFALASQGVAFVLAVLFTGLLLRLTDVSFTAVLRELMAGALGTSQSLAYVLRSWAPLMLITAGLLITFAAGLWNIGAEGQITMGAIFTTGLLRLAQAGHWPPILALGCALAAGMLGGAVWALLAGVLKVRGRVHEIFTGLGLNFVAGAATLWLIFGPWRRPGVASMSGTEPFDRPLWLPELTALHVSPWALVSAGVAIVVMYALLKWTVFGLGLRAVGGNPKAAFILGLSASGIMLGAFAVCGALAGLTGALQVTAIYHRLIPSIASGYGYLGLLVAMLAAYRAVWALPVALFFAAINVGSIQLPISLQIDSSLAGVIQGSLVLFVLITEGLRRRMEAVWKRAE